MLSSGNGNPYLRPEYLNPPPTTTMDSKKSPLALLAQTCSQIGADPQVPATNNKNCNGAATAPERKKSVSERDKSSPLSVGGSSSSDGANRVQQPAGSCNSNGGRPSPAPPKSSGGGSKNTKESMRLTPSSSRDSDRRSKSTSPKNPNRNSSAAGAGPAVPAATASAEPSAAPSGGGLMTPSASLMDPAAALSLANYKSLMAQAGMAGSPYSPASYPPYSGGFGPSGYPPGLDLGAYASALNAAVAKSSMPFIPTSTAAMMSGYLASQHPAAYSAALAMQYGRMKNPSLFTAPSTTPTDGGNCRDPYCTGCPGNNNNNNPSQSSPSSSVQHHMVCTAGCGLGVQCEHLKVPIPAHHLMAMPSASSSPGGGGGPSLSSPGNQRPYVCNWIVGDNYCGKRFPSSDDLLQHLRTHTNLSSSAESAAAASASASVTTSSSSAVHPSSAAAFAHPSSMMRAYPTPPLSPLSAARYHPYGKSPGQQQHPAAGPSSLPPQQAGPQGFPAGLFHPHHHAAAAAAAAAAMAAGSSPYPPSALFHHPALAPYYSHLSLFAPRGLGSAPLPP